MWTNDGILIHRIPDDKARDYTVYASDPITLEIFADEQGILKEFFKEQLDPAQIGGKDEYAAGIYAAEVGYGPRGNRDPLIYWMMRIGELDWSKVKKATNP